MGAVLSIIGAVAVIILIGMGISSFFKKLEKANANEKQTEQEEHN